MIRVFSLFVICSTFCFGHFALAASKLQIVASFSVLSGLASEIIGSQAEVSTLLPLNVDPHHFSPSVKDLQRLQAADLIIINGLNFESWLEPLIQAQNLSDKVVRLSQGIVPIFIGSTAKLKNPTPDPHAWLNTNNAEIYAKNFRDAILKSSKVSKPVVLENFKKFSLRLAQLRVKIKNFKSQNLKQKFRILIPHESLAYLGQEMGLEIVSLHSFNLSDFDSANRAVEINSNLSQSRIDAAFAENSNPGSLFERLVRENKIKQGPYLITETLASTKSATPYSDLLRSNFESISGTLEKTM